MGSYQESVTQLIKERFDKILERQQNGDDIEAIEPVPTVNGVNHRAADHMNSATPPAYKRKASEEEDDDLSDVVDSPAPKKAKSKGPRPGEELESDEKMAARLQAELNAPARATRGAGTKRKTPVKRDKKTKKKSATKVRDDDDLDSEDGEKPEKEKKGGFHVRTPFTLLLLL